MDTFFNSDIKEKCNSNLKNRVKELRLNYKNSKLKYEIFSKFIVISTKETNTVPLKMNSGWCNLSSDILKALMDKRSRTLDLIRQNNFNVKQLKVWRGLLKQIYRKVLN